MKLLSYWITIVIVICLITAACGNKQKYRASDAGATAAVVGDTIVIANDSLEYEVIIFEPGFNAFLATQPPRGYYSQSAMELSNYLKITEYNLRVNDAIRYGPNLYPMRIDYDRNVDYGYEVNYLLFNYFLFFERRYNQRL
jgi:hypothetical protein